MIDDNDPYLLFTAATATATATTHEATTSLKVFRKAWRERDEAVGRKQETEQYKSS